MDKDEISYKTLRKIQQMEKNSPILTQLKPNFYNELSDYLDNLNKRLDMETSSQKQILLKDEIKNMTNISTNIYEQREKKILLAAISKARGGSPDLNNMVDDEKDLFENILEYMFNFRKRIFNLKSTNNSTNNNKVKLEQEEKIEQMKGNTNPILRVTKDIPEFIGTDEKKYNLRNNDLISLPIDMSQMLLKKGVVERISK